MQHLPRTTVQLNSAITGDLEWPWKSFQQLQTIIADITKDALNNEQQKTDTSK